MRSTNSKRHRHLIRGQPPSAMPKQAPKLLGRFAMGRAPRFPPTGTAPRNERFPCRTTRTPRQRSGNSARIASISSGKHFNPPTLMTEWLRPSRWKSPSDVDLRQVARAKPAVFQDFARAVATVAGRRRTSPVRAGTNSPPGPHFGCEVRLRTTHGTRFLSGDEHVQQRQTDLDDPESLRERHTVAFVERRALFSTAATPLPTPPAAASATRWPDGSAGKQQRGETARRKAPSRHAGSPPSRCPRRGGN